MDDCPTCGRRLDDGKCTRCAVVAPAPETTEARSASETTAAKRAVRKK